MTPGAAMVGGEVQMPSSSPTTKVVILLALSLTACDGSALNAFDGEDAPPETPTETTLADPSGATLASLAPTLQLKATPAAVGVGQTFAVEARVTNPGAVVLKQVSVGALVSSGVGAVKILETASPSAVDLAPLESQVFRFIYEATEAGALTLSTRASGRDELGFQRDSELGEVTVTFSGPPLLSVDSVTTAGIAAVGRDLTVTVRVTNGGQGPASNVAPVGVLLTGTASATLVSGPAPASAQLSPGASAEFLSVYRLTAAGRLTVSAGAAG
ncbi:MAG: hypothetical protein ACT4TC_10785 [Myxococcaceae bacterium]